MRLLITDTVPLNGGDEALLRATVESLQRRFPEAHIDVLCKDVERARALLPDLDLESDLMFVADREQRRRVLELYRLADVVISAPGGFLSDHYDIDGRLRGLETAQVLGRPVVVFAQSIGPLVRFASRTQARQVLNRCAAVALRDEWSHQHLVELGVDPALLCVTADAAFLWRDLDPNLFRGRGRRVDTPKLIGMCFRPWPMRDTAAHGRLANKAAALAEHVLASDPDRRLRFLSTCQGVPGYKDDSLFAQRIVALLPAKLAKRCEVDGVRHAPREMVRQLSSCDAVIAMRLHTCILAMLGGTPAMGVGYERKTAETFDQMGFEDFQVDADAPLSRWTGITDRFLARHADLRSVLPMALDVQAQRARETVELVEHALVKECVA